MIKRLTLLAALAAAAMPVQAGPAGQLAGTWECQVAGEPPTATPPIVWFGQAASEGKWIDTVVDLDAFEGKASGVSDLLARPGGWWRVQPQEGVPLMIKPLSREGKNGAAAMLLRLGQASYDCRRLPRAEA